MCGIAGIASSRGAPDRARLAAMSATLVHRGPDGDGLVVDGPVGLAARRLSIVDLETGDQPVASEDGGVTVVQDGAIYNARELRGRLERAGHRFTTQGGTEVLAHLYEEHGEGFAGLLRGMFAVAIWDARRRRLVLARDRFGIKPLVYRTSAEGLEFASDLRALTHGEIDLDALEAFLAFGSIPAPLTIFRDVRKLPPGHLLVWEAGGPHRLERFARPAPAPADEVRSEDLAELAEELRSRLRDSVRAHLVGAVPAGVLLSGGVDSATLAALAAQESAEPLRTFSIGFAERSFDELGRARLVAERYGTRHRELILRPDVALVLPALADAFDEPFADPSALPTYLVAQLAAEDVKVALSGEGGTDLFDVDHRAKRFVRAAHLPRIERRHSRREIFTPEARAELTGRRSQHNPVDPLQGGGLGLYVADDLLVKIDRASMAHSLEARVPFLDTVVTNLALALPARYKVRGAGRKVLLRRAVEPLLPRSVVHGRKRGFSIPAAAWLRDGLEPFARETLSADALRRQGFFRPETATRLLDEHVARREDRSRQLWSLLAFTLWYERHVEGARRDVRLGELVVDASS